MKLECTNSKSSFTILKTFFGSAISDRNLKNRISQNQFYQISDYWKIIPSYLRNNIINGGLSELYVTESNEIFSFAMVPHYAKLLLQSNAVLSVLVIDGTFQCSIYRGTIIIVMVVSSNRTNIPVGWAWGPGENERTISMILKLIKQVNSQIETMISDDGAALKTSINEVFPNATHKLCAWHLGKSIRDKETRNLFWKLVKSDPPIIFQ